MPATGEDACNEWLGLRKWAHEDHPWSANNISMAKRWIDECVDQSGHCKESITWKFDSFYDNEVSSKIDNIDNQFLPRRLLDLCPNLPFQATNTTPDYIKLIETDSLWFLKPLQSLLGQKTIARSQADNLKYAALSYCWGGVDPRSKTTNDNFKDGYRDIEFSSLPKCLQDAVTVARSLDIRYLWIDALCIIQGDVDDWAREAGTMLGVFQNAFLTIGAAASTSFDEGFLNQRPNRIMLPFSSSCEKRVSGKISLWATPSFPSWPLQTTPFWPVWYDLEDSEWNRRGWVWQEQNLSKRLLIFGKQMIHFKCAHCTRSENGFVGPVVRNPREESRDQWTWWIPEYSNLHLTYLCDKLPAISGIAHRMDRRSQLLEEAPAIYLAGIWFSSQETEFDEGWRVQICWNLKGQSSTLKEMLKLLKSTDLQSYSAPSWSWASRSEGADWGPSGTVDGTGRPRQTLDMTEFKRAVQTSEAQIESHRMIRMGPDRMGRVKPGSYLRVKGLLRRTPLNLNAAKPNPESLLEWKISSHFQFSLDWKYFSADQDNRELEGGIHLFCLWRSTYDNRGTEQEICQDILRGLLLLKDSKGDCFYRVGAFKIGGKEGGYSGWAGLNVQGCSIEAWEWRSVQIL